MHVSTHMHMYRKHIIYTKKESLYEMKKHSLFCQASLWGWLSKHLSFKVTSLWLSLQNSASFLSLNRITMEWLYAGSCPIFVASKSKASFTHWTYNLPKHSQHHRESKTHISMGCYYWSWPMTQDFCKWPHVLLSGRELQYTGGLYLLHPQH